MNRIVKSFCMIAVMALAFTACKKNDTEKRTLVFKGTTEQMVVVDDAPGAKVYLNNKKKIRFEQGDLIRIINIPDTVNGTGTTTASIFKVAANLDWVEESGNIGFTSEDGGAFFAYYPGGNDYVDISEINDENRVTFTLPNVQYYEANSDGTPQVPKNALYIAGKNGTEHDLNAATFKMYNICGVLGVRLYSTLGAVVESIEVFDKGYNISGDVQLKIHEVDPDYMTSLFNDYDMANPTYVERLNSYLTRVGYYIDPDQCSKSVTLDCTKNGGVTLANNANNATEFYIVMRPLALSKGSDMYIHLKDGRTAHIASTAYNCITPNTIRRLMAMNVDLYMQ